MTIQELAERLGKITAEKQAAYGNSFHVSGQILELLYPNGVVVGQYQDMLAIARIIDKLGRIANQPEAFGEDPYIDIAGYGLIGAWNASTKPSEIDHGGGSDEVDYESAINGTGALQ